MRVIIFCPDFPDDNGLVITKNATFTSPDAGMLNFILPLHNQPLLGETGDTAIYEVSWGLKKLLDVVTNMDAYFAKE